MHDPLTVAFEIKSPFKKKTHWFPDGYRKTIITIYHKDPESDGTDDSCGWFMRTRHGDKDVLEKIKKEFNFNLENNYWFDKEGKQIFSTIGTVVQMYRCATYVYFNSDSRKRERFMKKHLLDIIHFSENPVDCIGDDITNKWNHEKPTERFDGLSEIIYGDILRKDRKWYNHPRWHIWHWRIQIHPLQNLKRRFWDKCSVCGKRGFKAPGFTDWNGTKVWHEECDNTPTPSLQNN